MKPKEAAETWYELNEKSGEDYYWFYMRHEIKKAFVEGAYWAESGEIVKGELDEDLD